MQTTKDPLAELVDDIERRITEARAKVRSAKQRGLSSVCISSYGYAETWRANLSMAIYDEAAIGGVSTRKEYDNHVCISIEQCNATADRIMRHFFNLK